MDGLVQESANLGSVLKTESGVFIPISESTVDYAKLASKNFKLVAKSFDINQNTVTLTENGKNLVAHVNGTKDRIVVSLEESLQHEINSFYKLL